MEIINMYDMMMIDFVKAEKWGEQMQSLQRCHLLHDCTERFLDEIGEQIDGSVSIKCQKAEIFEKMHRI